MPPKKNKDVPKTATEMEVDDGEDSSDTTSASNANGIHGLNENDFLKNPDPADIKKRIELRHGYRELHDSALRLQEDPDHVNSSSTEQLSKHLKTANTLYDNVTNTREAVMDSSVLATLAQQSKQKAQALHTDFIKFDPKEYVTKFKQFMKWNQTGPLQKEWEEFGCAMQPFFKKSPPLSFMFGSFERGPPKQLKRAQRKMLTKEKEKENVHGKETVPKQLLSGSETEKHEVTTEEVERILEILRVVHKEWKTSICYFEFVVNPNSFGQTIENMFYTSFLIRDGYAKIFLDDDKLPVIEPVTRQEGDVPAQDQNRQQVITKLTKSDWEEIVRVYHIKEPLIPTRESRDQGTKQ